MWMGSQRHSPVALPPGKTRYPLFKRLGGLQDRSKQVQEISPLPAFDPWAFQPITTRFTDYVIPAHECVVEFGNQVTES